MTIVLENISKKYGDRVALEKFNIRIEWDRCYAFVGPEGCGKSTVLKIFMEQETPDSGQVHRMGDYKYPTLHSAYVPQECGLNLKKSALWNVKQAHRWIGQNAAEELAKFMPKDRINIPASELTEAERRFTEIVKAQFTSADFIVLDDPFRGMTDEQRQQAIAYVRDFRGSRPLLIADRNPDGLDFDRLVKMQPQNRQPQNQQPQKDETA